MVPLNSSEALTRQLPALIVALDASPALSIVDFIHDTCGQSPTSEASFQIKIFDVSRSSYDSCVHSQLMGRQRP